ncbi:hypothetical protein QBC33DRAFT_548858 [Phialemonium atrogriseum]|uniref:Uncharacterized protein n=1 Tax=Phialemonium atrogriseum TaxID=1093897 RepID=A0AAJ0BTB3_9PEZI|nr:uncharacterized protein QBC33DRAFT_548858 [Phialemonium atrogriseum]KAK1763637.1 hypothetical protein QBC33DRAFT_548858 [Phialemonium atrogriseum]
MKLSLAILSTALLALAANVGASAIPIEESQLAARAKVNPSQLNNLAKVVSQSRSSIQSQANQVDSHSRSVLSSWTGSAAKAYQKQLSQFDADAKHLAAEMNNMAQKLKAAAKAASG